MKTIEPIPTLALDDLLHMAASAIEDLLEHADPNTSYYSGVWSDVPGKLRTAAMLQAGTLTNEDTKQAWTGIPDIDNAINMLDRIDTLESCDDDRIEAVKTVLRRLAGNSPVIPGGYVMVPKEPTERMVIAGFESEPDEGFSELQVWEAYEDMSGCEQAAHRARLCWAAMLAAAPQPHNAPQNIPEIIPRWIPVSERMPEDRISVILWDAEIGEVTSGHYSHKTQTFYHCGDAIENEITHWMPPPCAPQEVKGEHQIRDEMDMGARITSHRFKV